jgi:hypothetical protein
MGECPGEGSASGTKRVVARWRLPERSVIVWEQVAARPSSTAPELRRRRPARVRSCRAACCLEVIGPRVGCFGEPVGEHDQPYARRHRRRSCRCLVSLTHRADTRVRGELRFLMTPAQHLDSWRATTMLYASKRTREATRCRLVAAALTALCRWRLRDPKRRYRSALHAAAWRA